MSVERFSWRSVFAGLVTALAVSVVMTLLGAALGFTTIDPMSNSPFAGLGTAIGIWTVATLVVSFAAGAFMAGYIAGRRGGEHGFVVWGSMVLAGVLLGGMAVSSAINTAGNIVQSAGSGAASVVSTVGGGIASAASSAVEAVSQNVNLDLDTDELQGDVAQVLRDTEVETLQPEYLRSQMREARSDLRRAVSQIAMDSDNYDSIIASFLNRQQERLAAIGSDVDREAAVTALMNNRDLSRAEAGETVDTALAAFDTVRDRAEEALTEGRMQIEEAREQLAAMAARARVEADQATSTLARSALMAAVALIAGAVLCWFAGMFGARYTPRDTVILEERRGVEITLDNPVPPRDTSVKPRSV